MVYPLVLFAVSLGLLVAACLALGLALRTLADANKLIEKLLNISEMLEKRSTLTNSQVAADNCELSKKAAAVSKSPFGMRASESSPMQQAAMKSHIDGPKGIRDTLSEKQANVFRALMASQVLPRAPTSASFPPLDAPAVLSATRPPWKQGGLNSDNPDCPF